MSVNSIQYIIEVTFSGVNIFNAIRNIANSNVNSLDKIN